MTNYFTEENTNGFSSEELTQMNIDLENRVDSEMDADAIQNEAEKILHEMD
jgi:hypothetical protein